ncbi:MAG: DinB family protein [Cyclobacteriaceae bacterium]|nr:DinB family protein [Cyclobacteriaceae bacterium]MDH4296314.1 DinB family protein [Cyclobacteriaceae bacterium]MDH5249213.1 DinB family protein [Cyclobacteriaceae bacterium]
MKNLFALAGLIISMSAFGQGQLQKEASGSLAFASDHIMQLAQAIPAEKYSWTPQDGVRSVRTVLTHIISANYFFATKLGAKLPEGVKMESLELDLQKKEDIAAALKQSSALIVDAVKNAKDADMATKVEYPFPGEYTNMSSILIALSHANEHLGQLIAYARTNGIKPPWSE